MKKFSSETQQNLMQNLLPVASSAVSSTYNSDSCDTSYNMPFPNFH
jgi:hypothetical protein